MQNQQNNLSIKLEVNINDVNLVLASLGKQPYESVVTTVEKIRAQAVEQVNALTGSEGITEE